MRAAVLILAFLLMAQCLQTLPAGAFEGRASPSAVAHQGCEVIRDFSNASASNVVVKPSGRVELARESSGVLSQELQISASKYPKSRPAIAVDSNDSFIIAWDEERGPDHGLYARRLDSQGKPLGTEITVAGSGVHQSPDISVNSSDYTIIAWPAFVGGASYTDIFAVILDPEGYKVSPNIRVSSGPGTEARPSIAVDSKDRFIVAWSDDRAGTGRDDIYAQRFDPRGDKLGAEMEVCTANEEQFEPNVAVDGRDNFLITWMDDRGRTQERTPWHIFGQMYDPEGNYLGRELQFSAGKVAESSPTAAAGSKGQWMVVWEEGRDNESSDICGQRIDLRGVKLGGKVTIKTGNGTRTDPVIRAVSRDRFAVAWQQSDGRDLRSCDICAQQLDGNGSLEGREVVLCSARDNQVRPRMAVDSGDGFMVAWQGNRSNSPEILARRCSYPVLPSGELTLPELAPRDLWRWSDVTANVTMPNPQANSVTLEVLAEDGAAWNLVPANGSLLFAKGVPKLKFRARLASLDYDTSPALHDLTVRFIVNSPPVVSLPKDISAQKNLPENITASASDPDMDELRMTWSQLEGPPASINNASTTFAFVPARSGTYLFSLTAFDGYSSSAPALVNVTVHNRPPAVATHGRALTAEVGDAVRLTATATDQDGDQTAICWTQTSGKPVHFRISEGANISFTAGQKGRYQFRAAAYDGEEYSQPVYVNLTVSDPAPPLAPMVIAAALAAAVVPAVIVAGFLVMRRIRNKRMPPGR